MPIVLTAADVREHSGALCELFRYMKSAGGEECEADFAARKIAELAAYLDEGRAFAFAELEGGEPIGFIWAANIPRSDEARMHVLYFAVAKAASGRGIGTALIECVEDVARKMNIERCELNVSRTNLGARAFYARRSYIDRKSVV